jgi:predicted DNA-binding transcriptional regulator YafY
MTEQKYEEAEDDDIDEPETPKTRLSSILPILEKAIRERLVVQLAYTLPRSSGSLSFRAAPFLVREISSSPYLLIWDLDEEDPEWRLLEVARITHAALGWCFAKPAPDDEDKKRINELVESLGELIPVVVRLTPLGVDLARNYPLTPTQTFEFQPSGDAIIRCQNVTFRDALHWVLSWGPEVEVIEPAQLREKVANELRRALYRHLQTKIEELTTERDLLVRGL